MNKEEILRKHLGQTPAEFQDLGKKNTLNAMEEYAELYHQNKVKTLGLFSVSNSVCPECGYPKFKKSFEDFERCHGCEWTGKGK